MELITSFGISIDIFMQFVFIGGKYDFPFFIKQPYRFNIFMPANDSHHAVDTLAVIDGHIKFGGPGNQFAKHIGLTKKTGHRPMPLVAYKNVRKNPKYQKSYQTNGKEKFRID
jgi:hypothetical protein